MIWFSISILIVAIIIGFLSVRNDDKRIKDNLESANIFLLKLEEYVQSQGKNNLSYDWLIIDSPKMQLILGEIGIAAKYKPPAANYVVSNYPVIVNTLPDLRQAIENRYSWAYEDYMTIRETILRYKGTLENREKHLSRSLKNPLIWFFTGISQILSIPFQILSWAGLLSSNSITSIKKSFIYKIFSGLIGLIELIGSIISIFNGWDKVILSFNYFTNIIK